MIVTVFFKLYLKKIPQDFFGARYTLTSGTPAPTPTSRFKLWLLQF